MLTRGSAWRVGAVAVATVVVAEAAVWLLRPREAPLDPAPVSEREYFTAAQIERGQDYQRGQILLLVAGLGAQGAVLGGLALGRPAAVRRRLDALGAKPVRGAALAGAGLSVALAIVALPAAIGAHERAVDYGVSTQALDAWLGDVAKSTAIGAALAAGGATLLIVLVRRFDRRWWLPGSAAAAAIAAVFAWLAPVVLAPLFNRFEALPQGSPARAEVLSLGERAGVDIGEVYRVDASRRVTSLNAYVNGLGPTKRVVLYDNLIEATARRSLRSVVAHELAHVKHDDIPRGLAFVALLAPMGLLFTRELADALSRRSGLDPRSPAALPSYALGLALASVAIGFAGNRLSREVEASADTFALRLTGDPAALIDVQRQLVVANVGDPDPPGIVMALFGSHPPAVERIGAAVTYEREEGERSAGSAGTLGK